MADLASKLAGWGLSEQQVDTVVNKDSNVAMFEALLAGASSAGLADADMTKEIAILMFEAATVGQPAAVPGAPVLGGLLASGEVETKNKVIAGVKFLNKVPEGAAVDEAKLRQACGAGVVVSDADMEAGAKAIVDAISAELTERRYQYPIASLISKLKADPRLKWGNLAAGKSALDAAVLDVIGPRTEADNAALKAGKKAKKGGAAAGKSKAAGATAAAAPAAATAAAAAELDAGKEDPFAARDLKSAENTPELLAEHAKVTGGHVITRFPPEPNGFLHIGHAKSMNLNFKGAFQALKVTNGKTIFRYDDTNPEAESQEYIDSQADNVAWLGWKPWKVTHSSDYFDQLHAFAVQLIKQGQAYVCHQTSDEVKASREIARKREEGGNPNSPWRDRSVEENLAEFQKMRDGAYAEGTATLRMKIDMTSPNPCMWDPVAYRIKFVPHPRTGDAWCIYPSYDFTHCIVDSIEHIDYSLCTLEFEVRRDSYYWLLEALNIWRPHVFEFSRLNITDTVLSKRKILKLVTSGTVRGWDDPRILTINGMRRRGYSADAINALCDDVGVTRKENVIEFARLEHHVRNDMNARAARRFAVIRPLEVVLANVPDDFVQTIEVPDFPDDPARGSHVKTLTKVLYIEQTDFRLADEKKYFGLAPGKLVGLRYAGNITCVDVVRDEAGNVVQIVAEYDAERSNGKPKGNLHWASGNAPDVAPLSAQVRLYKSLFTVPDPDSAPGGWESVLADDSEVVLSNCYVDAALAGAAPGEPFQFERLGFYVVDQDSGPDGLVFNETVSLKASTSAKSVRK